MKHRLKWIIGSLFLCAMSVTSVTASEVIPAVTCLDYGNVLSADFSEWSLIPDSNDTYSLRHLYSGLSYIHERPIRTESTVAKGLNCEFSSDSIGFVCSNELVRAVLEKEEGHETFSLKIDKSNPDLDIASRIVENMECSL